MRSFNEFITEINDNASEKDIRNAIQKTRHDLMRAKGDEIVFHRTKLASLFSALEKKSPGSSKEMKEEFIRASGSAKKTSGKSMVPKVKTIKPIEVKA